jgi:hypothetical protein
MDHLIKAAQGVDPRLTSSWVPRLDEYFEHAGLEDVVKDVRNGPMHLELAQMECNLVLPDLVARTTQNEALAKQLTELLPVVAKQVRHGACWAFTRYTVVGRKPGGTG